MTVIGTKGVSEGDISAAVGAVDTIFGRAGNVSAVTGDYTTNMITVVSANRTITSAEYQRFLYTEVSAQKNYAQATASELTGSASHDLRSFSVVDIRVIASAYSTTSVAGGNVTSVFGRTGAVVGASADYNASQISNGPNKVIMTTAQSDKLSGIEVSAQVNPSVAATSDLSGDTALIWSPNRIIAMVTAYANPSAVVQSFSVSPFTTVARITQAGEVTYRRNINSLPNNTIVFTTQEELSAFKLMSVVATAFGTAGLDVKTPVSVDTTCRNWLMSTGWKASSEGFSYAVSVDSSGGFGATTNGQAAFAVLKSNNTVNFGNSGVWQLSAVTTQMHFSTLLAAYLGASGDDYEAMLLRDSYRGYGLSVAGAGATEQTTVMDYYALNENDVIPFIAGVYTNSGARQTAHARLSGKNTLQMHSPPTGTVDTVNSIIYPVEFRGSAMNVYHVSARCSGAGAGASIIAPIMTQIGGAGTTVDAIDWNKAVIFAQYRNPSSVNENLGTQFDRPKSYPMIIPNNGSTVSILFSQDAQCSGGQAYAYILECTAMQVFHTVVTGPNASVDINLATSAVSSVRECMAVSQCLTTCTTWPAGVYQTIVKSSSTVNCFNSLGLGNDPNGLLYVTVATMPRDS